MNNKLKYISQLTPELQHLLRNDIMACVGHYVNDIQMEIWIEDQLKDNDYLTIDCKQIKLK